MTDGRKNNGGHKTAGRKSKAEELKLVEKLTPYEDKAIKILFKKIDEEDLNAVKMFFEYLYGKPKQQIDSNTNMTVTEHNVISLGNGKNPDETT